MVLTLCILAFVKKLMGSNNIVYTFVVMVVNKLIMLACDIRVLLGGNVSFSADLW